MEANSYELESGVRWLNEQRAQRPKPMQIRPLTAKVLIQLLPLDDRTDGGLYLPDIAKTSPAGEKARPRKGIVIATGIWRKTKQGLAVLPDFKPGETVLVNEYLCTKLRGLHEDYRICFVDDVLAIVTQDTNRLLTNPETVGK